MTYTIDTASWAAALEDAGVAAPVAEFDITVNSETNVDEDGAPLEAIDDNGEPTLDALETDMAEDEAAVEEADDVVEKLEDTAVQLESMAMAIENRIEYHGGMTDGELQFMMIGLEGRINNPSSLFPSVESFSSGSRLAASNEALDSIKKGLKWVWEKLKAAIKAVMDQLRKWFDTTQRAAIKLKKRANAIKANATNLKGDPREKQIEFGKVRSFFIRGRGVASSQANAVSYINSLSGVMSKLLNSSSRDKWVKYVELTSAEFNKAVTSMKAQPEKSANGSELGEMLGDLLDVPMYDTAGYDVSNFGWKQNKEGGRTFWTSDELPGGRYMFVSSMTDFDGSLDTEKLQQLIASRKVDLVTRKEDVAAEAKFEVLDSNNMREIANAVESIADIIIGYQTSWQRRDRVVGDVKKNIDKGVNELSKLKDSEENKNYNKLNSVIQIFLRGFSNELKTAPKFDAKLISYAIGTSNDYLLYCTRSASMYGKTTTQAVKDSAGAKKDAVKNRFKRK